jgi:hypothetical protein
MTGRVVDLIGIVVSAAVAGAAAGMAAAVAFISLWRGTR